MNKEPAQETAVIPAKPPHFVKPQLRNDSGRRELFLRQIDTSIQRIRQANEAKEADAAKYGARLTINWDAVKHNYRLAKAMIANDVTPSAVLKANGYGFGAGKMAVQLSHEGCRHFFVAHLVEAIEVRNELVQQQLLRLDKNGLPDHTIFVLHGPMPGSEQEFLRNNIVPVLNNLEQVEAWARIAAGNNQRNNRQLPAILPRIFGGNNRRLPAILQIDTGMHRAGLSPEELATFLERVHEFTPHIDVRYIMSHLACSGDAASPANEAQYNAFETMANQIKASYPEAGTSLSASSGLFLDPKYHGTLARFGGLLHGMEPVSGPNPMEPVIRLQAKLQNIRKVAPDEGVGYGLTGAAKRPRTIATLAIGFADGLPRALGNKGKVYIGGSAVPIVGKVSMDMITVDISLIDPKVFGLDVGNQVDILKVGDQVDILNQQYTLDDMARDAGTIPADITCGFDGRFLIDYVHEGAPLVDLDMENISPDQLQAINERAQARQRAMGGLPELIQRSNADVSDEPDRASVRTERPGARHPEEIQTSNTQVNDDSDRASQRTVRPGAHQLATEAVAAFAEPVRNQDDEHTGAIELMPIQR